MCKERLIFFIAGVTVLLGLGLGHWVSPWFLLLTAVPGAGLLIGGLTGFCSITNMVKAMKIPPCGDRSPTA